MATSGIAQNQVKSPTSVVGVIALRVVAATLLIIFGALLLTL